MGWIIALIALWLIASYFYKGDGSAKSQVPATPKEPPRRITIDDLAREYDEVFEWGDGDEQMNYFRKWNNRTFVVRGNTYSVFVRTNPRVETYALDYKGEHTKQYVSLSLEPMLSTLVAMEKSNRGPFRADFLFPVNTSIDTLISKGCHEVIVQGTFSGNMTADWIITSASEGIGGVTAIFTDCKIVREL